jgi:hypothetical protein
MAVRKVTFSIEQDIIEQAQQAADADLRSLSNWLAVTIKRAVKGETPERQES